VIVTYAWLKEFVELPPPDELADLLTRLGLAVEHYEPGADPRYELEILSNRPDCLSVIGVAREIAAAQGTPLRIPAVSLKESDAPIGSFVAIEVRDPDLCPRYVGRAIYEVKVGPSPEWMVRRLEAAGLRSINNIVDVTNYVMLETGQPLHAFDATQLGGKRIVVRRAARGESITAIDGKKYALDSDVLVIADAGEAVAIAGVMGGRESEIGASTRTVILESACFSGPNIRRTSRRLGLASPSSYRFERGVSWSGVEAASRRAAALMVELGGGKLGGGSLDVAAAPPKRPKIRLRAEQVERVLGLKVAPARIDAILASLGVEDGVPPDWRPDLRIEEDLIEEVARLVGYDAIPDDAAFPVTAAPRDVERRVEQRIRELLARAGAQEVLTPSFSDDPLEAHFGPEPVRLRPPGAASGTALTLRRSLVPSLLNVLRTQASYREPLGPIFEIAAVYDGRDNSERARVGLAAPGTVRSLQGLVASFLEALTGAAPVWEPASFSFAKPGRGAVLKVGGREVGWIAEPAAEEGSAAELDFAALAACAQLERRMEALPRHPAVERDLAVVVEASVSWRRIESIAREASPPNLEAVEFFDLYAGPQVAVGKKSVAFRLTFRAADRTLRHEEVDAAVRLVTEALERALGASLR
jgi:phenylalanyl-tRNA synthetase beta chain